MMKKVMFDVGELKRSKLDCSEFLEFRKAVTSTLGEIMGYIKTKRKKSVKPDTMQIRNTPASLMTNSVSVAKVKTNTKKENIEHLLERSKLLNSYSPFFFKKKHPTSSTKFHSSGLPTKTSSHRKGAPPAHIRSKTKQVKPAIIDINMSDVKAYTMQIRNTPASLMTNNVSVPKAETHSKKEKIKHLSEEIHFQNNSKTRQDEPKHTKTNVQSVKHATKSIKHTRVSLTTNNVSETAKKPKTTKNYIALNKFRICSGMTQTKPKQTNTDDQNAKLTAITKKNATTNITQNNFDVTSAEKNTPIKNIIFNEMKESLNSYEMTQTKHRQTNIDDKTAKPALMSIKNAATNSISVPLEKPKPTKDNLVQVFAGLKKLYDSKKKRDHLVQNYTDIPIGKPATMLINHRSACLTTNNNSLPLDKLKPKEENTKYLLDELRKQTNCETVQYKPTYTNTTSAQSDTISVKHTPDTLTTNNDSLPVEKLKNKKENIDDMLKKIINLKYSIIQYESTPPKPTMKSTKHAPALLTTQNVRMKRRPKSMRGKIFRLR
ncbi:uncharacterized protein LOC132922888 isoform X1 [Rhopalosiphum padi]|uniref:uncharacterized protein LOC132922888 isoform X1 n=1 Tax=Rhopalosiphum padi TaxID=40932 RepID=UPI00298E7819|nr:uncharacterized protein LOC132922888 isoform X1 [Rhopalosiphum padi]